MITPYATVSVPTVASTQDAARARAAATGEAVLVVSGRQTSGRGRSGATWWEAPRAMYSSLAFRPAWSKETWPRLTLAAGLAVRTAIGSLADVVPGLKWPNDLVTFAGKLGGILTEVEGDLAVVGCGVNLWWPNAPAGVAAACRRDPGPGLARALAESWATALLETAAGPPGHWGAPAYREACVTIGCEITWDPDGSGVAAGIDDSGRLLVDATGGRVALASGAVRTVRVATVAAGEEHGGRGGDT